MLLDRHIFRNFRPKFQIPTITRPGQMWAIPEMPEVAARVATSGSFRLCIGTHRGECQLNVSDTEVLHFGAPLRVKPAGA